MDTAYKVIIADDHDGVRKGIKSIIEKGGDFIVVAQARDGEEAVTLVQREAPDLLILDVLLPRMNGEQVARQLAAEHPGLKILAVSSLDHSQTILRMLENGASGYLTKEEAPTLLHQASKDILLSGSKKWVSERLKRQVGLERQASLKAAHTLTHRERALLELLRDGQTLEQIADQLCLSAERVSRFVQVLIMKFDVETLEELLERC